MEHQLIFEYINQFTNSQRYLNKKEIMYRLESPVTMEKFWPILLEKRKENGINFSLRDKQGEEFWFTLTDSIKRRVVCIEERGRRNTLIFEQYSNNSFKKSVLDNALIDEAFFSSMIENWQLSRERAQELVENNGLPNNKNEQFFLNCFDALKFIVTNSNMPIDENTIFTIYDIVTKNTLENDQIQKYRSDAGYVWHKEGTRIVFEPPESGDVPLLMHEFISFINEEDIHPIIKSCIIHYTFFYIQPFPTANGTIAKFVSYFFLLRNGHDFFKFFSLSSALQEEIYNYYKSIQEVANSGNDLTYFIDFQTLMIVNSFAMVFEKFEKEIQHKSIDLFLEQNGGILSSRQYTATEDYINMNRESIDIHQYQELFDVSYDTARTDLNNLVSLGLFKKTRFRKQFLYKMIRYDELLANIDNLQNNY